MKLFTSQKAELDWSLDFKPRRSWPSPLPVIVAGNPAMVVAGFERQNNSIIEVLHIERPALEVFKELWPQESMAPLESLRFQKALKEPLYNESDFLISLPFEFQHYTDSKLISLKSLRPLKFMSDWLNPIIDYLMTSQATSSQAREIIDLLCDNYLQKRTWEECSPTPKIDDWLSKLKKLKAPKAMTSDDAFSAAIKQMPWPKGVHARWERQGDQAGIIVTLRAFSPHDWKKIKASFQNLELESFPWT